MRLLKQAFLSIVLLSTAPTALAQSTPAIISGQNDPGFVAALELWLEGEDLPALQALSDLAENNNTAAQIFLGQLYAKQDLYGPDFEFAPTEFLGPSDRTDASRRSLDLLTEAGKTEPLAMLLHAPDALETNQQIVNRVEDLFKHGEITIGLITAQKLLGRAPDVTIPTLEGDPTSLSMDALGFWFERMVIKNGGIRNASRLPVPGTEWTAKDIPAGYTAAAGYEVTSARMQRRRHAQHGLQLDGLYRELATEVAHWAPMVRYCDRHCPASRDTCASAATQFFAAIPVPFASPSERLLSAEQYWDSERIFADLVRFFPEARKYPDAYADTDICLIPSIVRLQDELGLYRQ
ncbi:hypothetical protein [Halocynthiibacter sp.]|uniref:hypothetical protein n=1 Tax=Halocynthiibacter sp. TaxID=1979210 RepID=UPI003C5B11EB